MARTYLVECYWPGVSEALLAESMDVAARADGVRHLESLLIPADEIVLAVFEASSTESVGEATRAAALPCERVIEIVRLAAP
jgi:hypothetical protein